jgi:DNA-binding transcriptional LysR family regulator
MAGCMIGFTQLRAFDAVTRAGTFTGAAERLAVTPAAVSLQISQLERQYGIRLFERIGRRVRLTPTGELLRSYAQRIFSLAEDADRALQGSQGFTSSRLRLAATPTTAGYYVGGLWSAIHRRYPGLRLELSVQNSELVKQRLLALEDDLGMLGGDSDHPDLVFHAFAQDHLVVIVAPGHPWARRRSVDLKSLARQPLILREPGSATRELLERRLRTAGIEPTISVEIASTEAIKRAVEAGTGVGVLLAACVYRDVKGGHLRALRLRPGSFGLKLYLAHHRERRDSPLLQAVLQAVSRH